MKCYDCGGEYTMEAGTLRLNDKLIGDFEVQDVKYFKCNKCSEFLFPEDTLKAIEIEECLKKKKLIEEQPICEFIGATEAAKILGISRQAIHKHRRIRRGFIYSTVCDGRKAYHKKSVKIFKKTGDGRFPLVQQPNEPLVKYVIVNQTGRGSNPTIDTTSAEEYTHQELLAWHSNTTLGDKSYVRQ